MKTIVILLATTTIASAQFLTPWPDQPKTMPWVEKGRTQGTATMSGNTVYLRDNQGKHIATIVREHDGFKMLDENGKPLERK